MSLSDIENRILDKLKDLDEKIDDLCSRTTKVESSLDNHYKNIEDRNKNKERKFYYIIALMGVGFTIQESIRSFL